MHGELHAVGEDLFIIEGQYATSVWQEMNVPNIAVYRAGDTLYLLDTGICPPSARPSGPPSADSAAPSPA